MSTGVIAVEKSSNRKIGDVSTTYVSQVSCPNTCPWINSGCYAESGMVGIYTRRLNKADITDIQAANNEATAIRNLSGKKNLRLHIVGDCKTNEAAKIVSEACDTYTSKHDNSVWTYTHAAANVDRTSWGSVSVLASVESITAAKEMMNRGYAAAIVVDQHKDTKAYKIDNITVIPCPEQTGKSANCASCKLCWNDKRLLNNKSIIAFAAHSQGVKKIQEKLVQIGS